MAEEKEGNKAAPNTEKLKALHAAMDKIEKSYGKGSIMKMGDEKVDEIAVIPTGSIALNAALGVGGYPRGRVIEIYGPESSGKTTLAIHAIAEAQKVDCKNDPACHSTILQPQNAFLKAELHLRELKPENYF